MCKFVFANHFKGKFVFENIFLCKLGQKFFNKVSGEEEIITNSCLFTISYLFTISCLFTFDRFSYVSIHLGTISSVNFCFGTFLFVNFENCFWRRRRRILMVRPARSHRLAGKNGATLYTVRSKSTNKMLMLLRYWKSFLNTPRRYIYR